MPDESSESRPPADTSDLSVSGRIPDSSFELGADHSRSRDDLELRPKPQHLAIDANGRTMNIPTQRDDSIQPSRDTRPLKPGESYLDVSIDISSANFSRIDPITDDVVREHLQNVESSFLPPISPLQTHNPDGIDDTYVFDRNLQRQQQKQQQDSRLSQVELEPVDQSAGEIPSVLDTTPLSPVVEGDHTEEFNMNLSRRHDQDPQEYHSGAYTPPTARKQGGDTPSMQSNPTTQSFETSPSPTAAAHARTLSRALSRASSKKNLSRRASISHEGEEPFGPELSSGQFESSADATTLHHDQPSEQTLRKVSDASQSLRSGKRPKYLKSRNASQRSSASSFPDHDNDQDHDEGDSDATVGLGADYALQTGGAIPAMGISRSMSNMLSRSVSMGSMASGFEELDDSSRMQRDHHDDRDISIPIELEGIVETPKPKHALAAPTDTVIARHVRNVQVPESLAKEYKTKRGLKTPKGKTQDTVFGTERKSKHMTLKEQSTTLDRLSKENFDLKLKVVFLNEKLGQLSEEGIKDMVKENVDLKTALAISQRDNKSLRRRTKQLEKQLREADERPATTRSLDSDEDSEDGEREEELIYLRERIEEYASEIERLKNENLSKEVERRRLAESLKTMGDKPGDISAQEESDVWKDLLEQETARREHVDDENRRLRDELFRIKQEGLGGLHHTTNIYNISKKGRPGSPSRPMTGHSDQGNGTVTSATLVDELERDRERLNHEVAELRREINAQASMLTSRNREKDRLYQEIEDLKLAQRRGGPAPSTVDTILERSASRAGHDRPPSRHSSVTNGLDDAERDEYENRQAEMRDRINDLKLQNQNLQTEIESCMNDFETVLDEKKQLEEHVQGLQAELDAAENDLLILQKERDEALQEQEAIGVEFERLRHEAQEEIDSLEEQEDRYKEEIKALDSDLKEKTEDLNSLQHKMREMSEAINQIEDKMDETNRKNDKLQRELDDCNQEVEALESKLRDSNDKTQRLNVQQENYQVEIGFLREEQENHIVKIGNLEATLDAAHHALHEEKERAKELEQRLGSERRQRELVANREKEEVQQFVNELNREAGNAKDESRKLRKMLTNKEVETTEWKERLHELENNLRVALGDLNGTRSSLLKSIEKLQRELENTVRELDATKSALLEKDRLIKQKDSLLESHGLESRKLSELLEKERQAHRNTKHQFDTFQKTHDHVSRTANSQEGRILELETTRTQDRRKIAQLESQFREQLTERNSLLLELWSRLSRICGSDWAHNNSLINGRALPSLESLATMLPGFSKNLIAAVKMIESLLGDFQGRIKGVERDLWKEYQALENQLDLRVKKVDRLEALVRNSIASGNLGSGGEGRVARLEEAYRQLKVENATLKAAHDARIRSGYTNDPEGGSPSPNIPTGPSTKRRGLEGRASTMRPTTSGGTSLAVSSTTNSNEVSPQKKNADGATTPPTTSRGAPGSAAGTTDNRWMFRLRDLEFKLKMEREARNLDRTAARQRLAQQNEENKNLRAEVVRLKRSGNFDEMEDGR